MEETARVLVPLEIYSKRLSSDDESEGLTALEVRSVANGFVRMSNKGIGITKSCV